MSQVFDARVCQLGEGPLWHPERGQLFWFDILGKRLMSRDGDGQMEWAFDEHVSAAGWVDSDRLLVASETSLSVFDVETGARAHVCDLEPDNPVTRSNDGRADPQGGFWIGTMGKRAEPFAGAIYRWYRGTLRQLFDRITVSNSICFSPDGRFAYFTDTRSRRVQRVALDADGWPDGEAEVFLDLRTDEKNPDGAVVDAEGNIWSAQWGAHRVACYDDRGNFLHAISFPAEQTSCPAFGGDGLSTLFVTSAAVGLSGEADGQTFAVEVETRGQVEHRVVL